MILRELADDIMIRRLVTPDDITQWRAGFVGAYQAVFSGPPYNERFYPSEAEGVYRKLTRTQGNITLVATRGLTQVVGFGAAIPLKSEARVSAELTGLVPRRHCFYLAELGVVEHFRGHGIGRVLLGERLKLIDHEQYSHVVLRVSSSPSAHAVKMYEAAGFEDMGVYTEVSAMRTDGRVKTDRRVFMCSVLSQVDDESTDLPSFEALLENG